MRQENALKRVAVIMAGGSGERFWPLSRLNLPKQLLRLTSETDSMLAEAVQRIAPMIDPEHVYVQTAAHLRDAILEAGIGIPAENVLTEPCKRNTSGCLAYATAHLLAKYGPDFSMAILTADHVIDHADRFRETVAEALRAAEEEQALVTIGITPTRPATGYGYVQARMEAAEAQDVFSVEAFHEKPNENSAQRYLDAGTYFWNSGMFFWTASAFLGELDGANPKLALATRQMAEAMKAGDDARVRRIFEGLEDLSIDYALMEKARRVAMVRAQFAWDDVGTWASLDRTRPADAQGNVTFGEPVLVDCRNAVVYNAPGKQRMAVGVVGMENVVVVATEDAVLVLPKDRAEEVKRIVQELKRRDAPQQ